jgi:hypothetical protein
MVTPEDSLRLWVGGGGHFDPGARDIHVASLVFGQSHPPIGARASYVLGLGALKNLRSIYWRSTRPEGVSLRYRLASEVGGAFTDWTEPVGEVFGRIVFNEPGVPARAVNVELIASGATRVHDLTAVYTDPNPGETPRGSDILVTLPWSGGQCRFATVTVEGMTTATPTAEPPLAPDGLVIRSVFDVQTNAIYEPGIEIGIQYNPLEVGSEASLKLFRWTTGDWEEITAWVDPIGRKVWGTTVGFSTFAVMEDTTRVSTGIAEGSAPSPSVRIFQLESKPNPFAGTMTVQWSLSMSSRGSLRVYDPTGRLIRTLVDGTLHSGTTELPWDGRDDQGNPVTSGVYFITLRSGDQQVSRKAVLLR